MLRSRIRKLQKGLLLGTALRPELTTQVRFHYLIIDKSEQGEYFKNIFEFTEEILFSTLFFPKI